MSACKEFIAAVDKVKELYQLDREGKSMYWVVEADQNMYEEYIKAAEQEVKIALKRMMEE